MITTSRVLSTLLLLLCTAGMLAQVTVGAGSYTTTFPGADAAGRNGFPSGSPSLSGAALNKPVPTNDWWSKLVKEGQADNLFNYPFTMKTQNDGLIVTYIPWGVIGDSSPIKIGLEGLSASQTTVSDHSDWTVDMNWTSGTKSMTVTSGVAMPFLYFEKSLAERVAITVSSGNVTIDNERIIIENASHGADFVVYAPGGSTWTNNGNIYSSDLNGKTYWSLAMLPQESTNITQAANDLQKYAYVFPANTRVEWNYNEAASKLTSTYTVTTEVKEGSETTFFQGLLPHQWSHLAPGSPAPDGPTYTTVRGQMKILEGNSFSMENTFSGILPTLPNLSQYSAEYDPAKLVAKIKDLENSQLDLWTDSYNEGQLMNRLIQTARIAHKIGETDAHAKLLKTVKDRLENWLTYNSGEVAFLFYYQPEWTAMLGYPAGHGQDNNINDHHFHWGYFIHAAAFIEQFEPGWVSQWGPMVEMLIRDAASMDREDPMFPFLRNFSPYAGHAWANGFASFPQGNDQESTSESMQFNSSLIHYGSITGNKAIRDLGIFLYTTEKAAVEAYWFDVNERNFQPTQQYGMVSRVWGNSYDNGTFWTSDITASYAIELYPIHGGSYYLAANPSYTQKIWNEIEQYTEILNPESTNPNLWHDTFWKYLAFVDPQKALDLYELSPNRNMKFGVSDAHTYFWLHTSNALGVVRPDITANDPIAMVFEKEGALTYIAHNYSNQDKTITYSNGFTMEAPAGKMTTSKDINVSGTLSTDFTQAYANSPVNLTLDTAAQSLTKVEFYSGDRLIATADQAPYEAKTEGLPLGVNTFHARLYVGADFELSNIVSVTVGEQTPYQGTYHSIPGTIEAGHYDEFEGGIGQNIAYLDLSKGNNGDFRTREYVDAAMDTNEGATVGWIDAGEWMEYSIRVSQTGYYTLDLRYASGNTTGGGPFHLLVNDTPLKENITVTATSSSNWSTWQTKTLTDIPLTEGDHILRLQFNHGGLNLGRATFTFDRDLDYPVPVARAGDNITVIIPEQNTTLDGSLSSYEGSEMIQYEWKQIYGPTVAAIGNPNTVTTDVNGLQKGVYKFLLEVTAGELTARDEVLVIVSETGNLPPAVSLTSPENNSFFKENSNLTLKANATDLDGSIAKVSFYQNETLLGEVIQEPYEYLWETIPAGSYSITAVATDDRGLETTSVPVTMTVETVKQCATPGSTAQQGQFSTGYITTYETIGNSVTVTFELLDTEKTGVVAYLWQESPFQESQMDQVASHTFSKTISGVNPGDQLSYAAKFAYAGGLAVTSYVKYTVGSNCSDEADTTPPSGLTANVTGVTATAASFSLNAEDASGSVIYTIEQNGREQVFSATAGLETEVTYTGLSANTAYDFLITVKDGSGNVSSETLTLIATTLESSNSACAGEANESIQGTFDLGYNYSFATSGSEVTIEFELLDDKQGVVAFLWKESPFGETPMTNIGGKRFQATLTGMTPGEVISYACKFAFANGLAVTKYFSYTVGDQCSTLSNEDEDNDGVPNAYDQCPDTPAGVTVNALGCEILTLPQDTFSIRVTSATCSGTDNGEISIAASATQYDYTVSISGMNNALTLNTNNQHQAVVSGLTAGTYTLCFTVSGKEGFEQCFTVRVGEPEPLSASAKVNYEARTADLFMEGSDRYTVTLNGDKTITRKQVLKLDLKPGKNLLEVTTALDCQGTFTKEIFIGETVLAYPNPTPDRIYLQCGGTDPDVNLALFDMNGNRLLWEERTIPGNRVMEFDLSGFASGIYFIQLQGATLDSTLKVIKK